MYVLENLRLFSISAEKVLDQRKEGHQGLSDESYVVSGVIALPHSALAPLRNPPRELVIA